MHPPDYFHTPLHIIIAVPYNAPLTIFTPLYILSLQCHMMHPLTVFTPPYTLSLLCHIMHIICNPLKSLTSLLVLEVGIQVSEIVRYAFYSKFCLAAIINLSLYLSYILLNTMCGSSARKLSLSVLLILTPACELFSKCAITWILSPR